MAVELAAPGSGEGPGALLFVAEAFPGTAGAAAGASVEPGASMELGVGPTVAFPAGLLSGAEALAGVPDGAAGNEPLRGTQWSVHRFTSAVVPGGQGCAVCTAATCTVQNVAGRPARAVRRGCEGAEGGPQVSRDLVMTPDQVYASQLGCWGWPVRLPPRPLAHAAVTGPGRRRQQPSQRR